MSRHATPDDAAHRIGRAVAGGGFLLGVIGLFATLTGAFEFVGIPMQTVLLLAVGFAVVTSGWAVASRVVNRVS